MSDIIRTCADPQCDRISLPEGVALVADTTTGAVYCDAMCWHTAQYGIRPPITQGEEIALEQARAWMARHR